MSLDRKLRGQVLRALVLTVLFGALYISQQGVGTATLLVGAWALFYFSQERAQWSLAARLGLGLGTVLLSVCGMMVSTSGHDWNLARLWIVLVRWVDPGAAVALTNPALAAAGIPGWLVVALGLLYVILFLLPVAAVYCFAELRRHQRNLAMRRATSPRAGPPRRSTAKKAERRELSRLDPGDGAGRGLAVHIHHLDGERETNGNSQEMSP